MCVRERFENHAWSRGRVQNNFESVRNKFVIPQRKYENYRFYQILAIIWFQIPLFFKSDFWHPYSSNPILLHHNVYAPSTRIFNISPNTAWQLVTYLTPFFFMWVLPTYCIYQLSTVRSSRVTNHTIHALRQSMPCIISTPFVVFNLPESDKLSSLFLLSPPFPILFPVF